MIDKGNYKRIFQKILIISVITGTKVLGMLPSDVDEAMAGRYQMEAMLNHTTKPIIFVTYEFGAV